MVKQLHNQQYCCRIQRALTYIRITLRCNRAQLLVKEEKNAEPNRKCILRKASERAWIDGGDLQLVEESLSVVV